MDRSMQAAFEEPKRGLAEGVILYVDTVIYSENPKEKSLNIKDIR